MKSEVRRDAVARLLFSCAGLMTLGMALSAGAAESAYPTKAVRIVVPYTPGGGVDLIGRIAAQELAKVLGQQVIVDNRPGGSTIIGADAVAKASPDGHTLLVTSHSTHAFLPNTRTKVPYDPDRDFEPVSLLVSQPFVLVVHPSMPVRSIKELMALAKARPGDLTYSSSGIATGTHFSGELLRALGNIDIRHIPYKGGAQSFTALAGGEVSMSFGSIAAASSFVKAGRLRMIALTGLRRSPAVPELPTIAEEGLPGYQMTAWTAMFAPGGTPGNTVERLGSEVAKAFKTQTVRDRLVPLGYDIEASSPGELGAYVRKERALYGKLMKMVGLDDK
ncbi:MAG: tripartite tricarboxylate transporter substrate binding protein [Burkholderiales bacterium]|nr:tripartite tricarboxylate transporter substrate binding protein [Burkholderiales bacterium]